MSFAPDRAGITIQNVGIQPGTGGGRLAFETVVEFPGTTGATVDVVVNWGSDFIRQERTTFGSGSTVLEWSIPLSDIPADTVGITANAVYDSGEAATDERQNVDLSGGGGDGAGLDTRTIALAAGAVGVGWFVLRNRN